MCVFLYMYVYVYMHTPNTDPCLCAPGHSTHRLLVDKAPGAPRNQECAVWSVVYTSDETVISGDSAGRVKLWDAQTGTLIKNHDITKWDVLALSLSHVSHCLFRTLQGT